MTFEERLAKAEKKNAELLAAMKVVEVFLTAMETCHVCSGTLALDDMDITHCENCSGYCEDHEEPDCTPLYVLYGKATTAVRTLLKECRL